MLVPTETPQAAGATETLTLHGLTPSTDYYFAIRSCDEVPNWSGLSNVAAFTTLPQDVIAPAMITDLSIS